MRSLSNGEKMKFLEQVKLFIKLLFSVEIYDELAQEFQQQADARRAANGLERKTADDNEGDCCEQRA